MMPPLVVYHPCPGASLARRLQASCHIDFPGAGTPDARSRRHIARRFCKNCLMDDQPLADGLGGGSDNHSISVSPRTSHKPLRSHRRLPKGIFYLAGAECASAEGSRPPWGPASRGSSREVFGMLVSCTRPAAAEPPGFPLVRL